jgi:hypothetical protein
MPLSVSLVHFLLSLIFLQLQMYFVSSFVHNIKEFKQWDIMTLLKLAWFSVGSSGQLLVTRK